jgi:hypothetical protein
LSICKVASRSKDHPHLDPFTFGLTHGLPSWDCKLPKNPRIVVLFGIEEMDAFLAPPADICAARTEEAIACIPWMEELDPHL